MKYFLVKNNKEFEWLQRHLFGLGICWTVTGKIIIKSLYYPLLVEIEDRFMVYSFCYNELYSSNLRGKSFKLVSTMMRKDKIKRIGYIT